MTTPLAILSNAIEQLEYGHGRKKVIAFASVASALADDAASVHEGPRAYFRIRAQSESAAQQARGHAAFPIDVPLLPFPAPESGSGGRGWAFSIWIQLSPSRPLSAPEPDSSDAGKVHVVKLCCGASADTSGTQEAEVLLGPTESPQQYRLIVRTSSPASASSFRSAKRTACACTIRLANGRWHLLAFSQTQPLLGVMNLKSPKLTAYVDGKPVMEQDMALPPVPFTRCSIGRGLEGCIAHPVLYAERLPSMHMLAIFTRGPNAPTLQHTLPKPLPSAVAPELQRAALVTPQSLDLMHEGMLTTGGRAGPPVPSFRGEGEFAGAGAPTFDLGPHAPGVKAAPPVLMWLDAAACMPVDPSTSAGSGWVWTASGGLLVGDTASQRTILQGTVSAAAPSTQRRGIIVTNTPRPSSSRSPSPAPSDRRAVVGSGSGSAGSDAASSKRTVGVVCPLWWSAGEAWGPEVSAGRKVYPAILPSETRLGLPILVPVVSAEASRFLLGSGLPLHSSHSASGLQGAAEAYVGQFYARLSTLVTVHSQDGASEDSSCAADTRRVCLARHWSTMGGPTRVLDLLRVVPLQHGYRALHSITDGHHSMADPVASLLALCASLVRDDWCNKEDLFQLRGFEIIAKLLHDRIEATQKEYCAHAQQESTEHASSVLQSVLEMSQEPASSSALDFTIVGPLAEGAAHATGPDAVHVRAWHAAHPITPATWTRTVAFMHAVRAYNGTWGPLFNRGLNYLLCDYKVWTRVVLITEAQASLGAETPLTRPSAPGATPSHAAGGPEAHHHAALLDYNRRYAGVLPCHPSVLAGYARTMSDLASADCLRFSRLASMDVGSVCDCLLASTRSLAATVAHGQALELRKGSRGAADSVVLRPFAAVVTLHALNSGLSAQGEASSGQEAVALAVTDTIASWVRTARLLLCIDIGAPVPVPGMSASGSSIGPLGTDAASPTSAAVSQFNAEKAATDVQAVIQAIGVLAEEHRRFQAGQDALLHALHVESHQQPQSTDGSGAAPGRGFVWAPADAVLGNDPYARSCSSLLDLLGSFLRSHPGQLHPIFEQCKGVLITTACAEADSEAVRISAINVITAVIALRRVTDPRLYSEAQSALPVQPAPTAASASAAASAAGAQGATSAGQGADGGSATGATGGTSTPSASDPATGGTVSAVGPSFSAAGKSTVLTAKEMQTRLLRALCNALAGRPYTTAASSLAALQLALAPDILSPEASGLLGAGSGATGGPGSSGPSGQTGNRASSNARIAQGMGRARAGTTSVGLTSAYEDSDLPLPGVGDLLGSGMSATMTGSGTVGTALTCPEALPILFLCFSLTTARLHKRSRLATALRAAGPFVHPLDYSRKAGLGNVEVAMMALHTQQALASDEEDNAGRLRVLLDLSLLLKRKRENSLVWMRQFGWQSWMLDLMSLPRARRVQLRSVPPGTTAAGAPAGCIAVVAEDGGAGGHPYADVSVQGSRGGQGSVSTPSHHSSRGTAHALLHAAAGTSGDSTSSVGRAQDRSVGHASHHGSSSSTNSAIAAIASDIFASLLCTALEMPEGWRVWLSTLPAIAERCRKDSKARTWASLSATAARKAPGIGSAVKPPSVPPASAAAPPHGSAVNIDAATDRGTAPVSARITADRAVHELAPSQADPVFDDEVCASVAHVIGLVLDRMGRERMKLHPDLRINILRTLRLAEARVHGAPYVQVLTSALPVIGWLRSSSGGTTGVGGASSSSAASTASGASGSGIAPGMEPLHGQEIWLVLQLLVKGLPLAAGGSTGPGHHVPGLALAAACGLVPHAGLADSAGAGIANSGRRASITNSTTPASHPPILACVLSPHESLFSDLCGLIQSLVGDEMKTLYDPEQVAFEQAQAAALSAATTSAAAIGSRGGARELGSVFGRIGAGIGGLVSSATAGGAGAASNASGTSGAGSTSSGHPSSSGRPGLMREASSGSILGSGGAVGLGLVAGTGSRPGEGSRIDAVLYLLSGLQRAVEAARLCTAVAESSAQEEDLASGLGLHHASTSSHSSSASLSIGAGADTPVTPSHSGKHAHTHHHGSRVTASGWAGAASSCMMLGQVITLALVNTTGLGPWETTVGQYKDIAYMRGRGRLIPPGGFRNPAAAAAVPSKTPGLGSALSSLPSAGAQGENRQAAQGGGGGQDVARLKVNSVGFGPGITSSSAFRQQQQQQQQSGDMDLIDVSLSGLTPLPSSAAADLRGGTAAPFDPFAELSMPAQPAPVNAASVDPFAIFESSTNGQGQGKVQVQDPFDAFGFASPTRHSATPDAGEAAARPSVASVGGGMALGGLLGQAVSDELTAILTDVAPPPLDRVRAIFAALDPGLEDIRKRMESSSFADFLLQATLGPSSGTGASGSTTAGIVLPASSAAPPAASQAATALPAVPTVGPSQLWLRELLAAEKKNMPVHPVLLTLDMGPWRVLRLSMVDAEVTREQRTAVHVLDRRKKVQAHWTAVRIDLLRALRIAARARMHADRLGSSDMLLPPSSDQGEGTGGGAAQGAGLAGVRLSVLQKQGSLGYGASDMDMIDAEQDGEEESIAPWAQRSSLRRFSSGSAGVQGGGQGGGTYALGRARADSTSVHSTATSDPTAAAAASTALARHGSVGPSQGQGQGQEHGLGVGPDDAVLEAVKVDSHEDRSRARHRLLTSKAPVLIAPTYAEYGRKGTGSGTTPSSPSLAGNATTAGAGTATAVDTDISKALKQAGAIKKAAITAGGPGAAVTGEEEEESSLRSRGTDTEAHTTSASAAGGAGGGALGPGGVQGSASASTAAAEEDDDDEPMGDAASTVAGSVGTSASADVRRSMGGGADSASASGGGGHGAGALTILPEDLKEAETNLPALGGTLAAGARAGGGRSVTFSARCLLIKAGGAGPGTVNLMSTGQIIWEPRDAKEVWDADCAIGGPDPDSVFPPKRPRKWHVADTTAVLLRCYRLTDSAAELFLVAYAGSTRRRRVFLAFESVEKRDKFVKALERALPRSIIEKIQDRVGRSTSIQVSANVGMGMGPAIYGGVSGRVISHAYVQIPRNPPLGMGSGAAAGFAHNYDHTYRKAMSDLLSAWCARKLSNFDYLMALNTLAGRTSNDLALYPVMPWILADYTSDSLDLSRPSSFRDLSRPMGALTGARLKEFRAKYESWDDEDIPPFLYGSHYSTGVGTVIHYLLRLHPFTQLHVTYQSGHYDVADRLFASVSDAWSLNTSSLSEVKELTPEWFTQPHFLHNHSRYKFGTLQSGQAVDHVKLPAWANGSPELFIARMRAAMESEVVSSMIHHWCDLIFGHQQRGTAAIESDNVFYYLTYAGGVDVDAIEEPALKRATQSQITHYGQTPLQLTRMPHAPRGPHPTVYPTALPLSPASAVSMLCEDNLAVVTAVLPSTISSRTGGAGAGGARTRAQTISNEAGTASAGGRGRALLSKLAAGSIAGGPAGTGAPAPPIVTVPVQRGPPPARHPGTILPGAARPLIAELRSYAQVLGLKSIPLPPASSSVPSAPAVPDWSALPFSFIPVRAFTHITTVPAAGCSVWRADTPSALPMGVYECLGPQASVEAQTVFQTVLSRSSETSGTSGGGSGGASGAAVPVPLLHLSFGDCMVLGSAAPAASLTLRVPLAAISSVLDTRGPHAPAWPIQGQVSVGHPSWSEGSLTSTEKEQRATKPFALPLGYRCVMEVSGLSAPPVSHPVRQPLAGGTAGISSTGTLQARQDGNRTSFDGNFDDVMGDEEVPDPAPVPPVCPVFHVWWPVAPNGYVTLGCVVTQARYVQQPPVSGTGTGAASDGSGPEEGISTGVDDLLGPGAVKGSPLAGPGLGIDWVLQAVPPAPDAVVCAHIAAVTPAHLRTFVPFPWLKLGSTADLAVDGAEDALQAFTRPGADVLPGSTSPLAPAAAAAAAAAVSAAMPGVHQRAAESLRKWMSAEDGGAPDALQEEDSLPAAEAAEMSPEELAARVARTQTVAAVLCSKKRSPGETAALRAKHSRGVALWSVGNRAGTFVCPVPLVLRPRRESQTVTDVFDMSSSSFTAAGQQSSASAPTTASTGAAPGDKAPLPEDVAVYACVGEASGLALGPPTIPPVPEVVSALYHRAHAHAACVSYDFAPWLAARTLISNAVVDAACGSLRQGLVPYSEQHWTSDSAVTGVSPSDEKARYTPALGVALPCAVAGPGVDFEKPYLHVPVPSGPAGRERHPFDALVPMSSAWDGSSDLHTPVQTAYSLHEHTTLGSFPVKPAIVSVRVLSAAYIASSVLGEGALGVNTGSALDGLGVGGGGAGAGGATTGLAGQGGTGATGTGPNIAGLIGSAAQPHTILSVDACGHVSRFRVVSQATYPPGLLSTHLDECTAVMARTRGVAVTMPGMPDGAGYAAHRLTQKALPHTRIRLLRDEHAPHPSSSHAHVHARCPKVSLINYMHTLPLPETLVHCSASPRLQLPRGLSFVGGQGGEGAGSEGDEARGVQRVLAYPPTLVTYPLAITDVFAGAFIASGCGPSGGMRLTGIDARGVSSILGLPNGSSGTGGSGSGGLSGVGAAAAMTGFPSSGLPLLPLAAKKSGIAAGADSLKKNLLSSVTNSSASDMIVEAPTWCGGADVPVSGQASLAHVSGSSTPVTPTVTVIEVDMMAVGHSDGSVLLWRGNGLEPLSTLLTLPSFSTRPDLSMRALCSGQGGPVTALSLSKEHDQAIVGYAREAWIVELSRCRPIQKIDLRHSMDPSALSAMGLSQQSRAEGEDPVLLSPPVCTGAATTSDGCVVVAATSHVMLRCALDSAGSVPGRDPPTTVYHAGQPISTLTLYSTRVTASSLAAQPVARACIPARVTCVVSLRSGGGTGDYEGAGAIIAVGRSDGVLTLYDGRDLYPLVSWVTPGRLPVLCVDVSPENSYLIAGCAQGQLCAFALPAFLTTVPLLHSGEQGGSGGDAAGTGVTGAGGGTGASGTAGLSGAGSGAGVGGGGGLDSFFDGIGAGLSSLGLGVPSTHHQSHNAASSAPSSSSSSSSSAARDAAQGAVQGVAKLGGLGKALAGEAGSVVKGLFGSVFGGGDKGGKR